MIKELHNRFVLTRAPFNLAYPIRVKWDKKRRPKQFHPMSSSKPRSVFSILNTNYLKFPKRFELAALYRTLSFSKMFCRRTKFYPSVSYNEKIKLSSPGLTCDVMISETIVFFFPLIKLVRCNRIYRACFRVKHFYPNGALMKLLTVVITNPSRSIAFSRALGNAFCLNSVYWLVAIFSFFLLVLVLRHLISNSPSRGLKSSTMLVNSLLVCL